jgi:endonuclease/exonuclease/phosphatase (EEP) superfamily protein YafD
MAAHWVLASATLLLIAATVVSFLHIPHGFVRSFAFPRLQFLGIALALALATGWLVGDRAWFWALLAGQAGVILVQAVSIAQFTPLRPRQSQRWKGDPDGTNTVSLLSANVKMSNRNYARAIEATRRLDPDIAVFMETDAAWVDALSELSASHPHVVAHPLDNAYGLVLFSRLALSETQVRDLVMEGVPSIVTAASLRDGRRFRLHVVHPEPPVPHIDSLGRDAELLKVADLVAEDPMPAIVCGDLNDVAWSNTTRMFQRLSRLLDPRVGRGFYNTFDARFPLLRWPLDHLFHDARFHLIAMKRVENIGSDHFPMFFKLALAEDAPEANPPPAEDAEDRAESREIQEEAKDLDREAIGVDWEK